MRFVLFLLLFPVVVQAQSFLPGKDSAFVRMIGGFPVSEPFDTSQQWKRVKGSYVYILSEKDLYEIFGIAITDPNRDVDFLHYHILGMRECRDCLFCRHEEGRRDCHRNACSYRWVWRVRDNKKAFKEIPAITFPGHVDAVLPDGRNSFFRDTLLPRKSDSTLTAWYTIGRGDCHARFSYLLQQDRYYPVLLLKELNYYGGCRAGGFRNFTVSFARPDGLFHFVKRTLFMEGYRKEE